MANTRSDAWPELPLEAWRETAETLHRWTQMVGKVRLALTPWINHSWHVPLYVTARGLTTSPMPHGERCVEIEFDFVRHCLRISVDDGRAHELPLRAQSVAAFHDALFGALDALGLPVRIHGRPNEVEDDTPFAADHAHAAYDPEYANRHWRVLAQAERVMRDFRARFVGKASPIHFFWGSFDLAVTRFSGRTAPDHPGGIPNLPDRIVREAYSHEVSSAGFWAGGGALPFPLFYCYAYPEPAGFADAPVRPAEAYYSTELREFVLPYDAVRTADDPDAALLAFLESTYAAAADRGGWDRAALERAPGPPR